MPQYGESHYFTMLCCIGFFSVLQNCAELFRFRPICNIKFFGYLSRLLTEGSQDIQSNVMESCFLFLNKHLRGSPA